MKKPFYKILLVGAISNDPAIYTYTTSFISSLKKLSHTVEVINDRGFYHPIMNSLGKLGTAFNNKRCNNRLLKAVAYYKPDVLFLIKAETITAQTLHTIKQSTDCIVINFYPDNPFTLWNNNSNENVLQRLPFCDCFLSWSSSLIPTLHAAGAHHACHFPFAYDENIFSPLASCQATAPLDICFIGTWEPTREKWLSAVNNALPNNSLGIWGNLWNEHCNDEKLKKCIRGQAVYNKTMVSMLRSSKIVLNFIREQNMDSHNMRTFEVPACGAFLLTQRTREQAELYFKEGESIECFSTEDELIKKITFYLRHESCRLRIVNNGLRQVQHFMLTQQLANYFNTCPSFTCKG